MKIILLIIVAGIVAAAILVPALWRSPAPAPEATNAPAPLPPSTSSGQAPPADGGVRNAMHIVTINTNYGLITFETYDADAPKTVANFLTLATKGFYNNLVFHRVVKGFVIQGGDPAGNGTGGPGYAFEDELNPVTPSYQRGYVKGAVAMANSGPNTNGSQFFIMLADRPALAHAYTIFGRVVAGQEAVDAIGRVPVGLNDRPIEPIVMSSVIVEPAP